MQIDYHINRGANTDCKKPCPKTRKEMSEDVISEPWNFQDCLH